MVKAKELLNYMCNDLDIRFFTGTSNIGMQPLYRQMDPSIMHYIPAVKDDIAIGMASGAVMSGINSCVLIGASKLINITNCLLNFNGSYQVPVLILVYADNDNHLIDIIKPYIHICDDRDLMVSMGKAASHIKTVGTSCAVLFNEGEVL